MKKPAPLAPGAQVSVVAPAGPFDRPGFEAGLAVLSGRYRPVHGEGIFAQHRYLAGDDARRLAELQAALSSADSGAVFCARGGYGAMRLLPELRFPAAAPKLLVGFSDITALHLAAAAQGWSSVHAPVLTQLGRQPERSVRRLFAILEGAIPEPLEGRSTLVPGVVEGRLLGGNLSVLTRLLGTPFLPPLDGAVLLLEDVGERPYRLDRLWTHLRLAGAFDQVRGIVLGEFTGCEERDASYSSAEVLADLARATGLPCAAGFDVGHGELNLAVPHGTQVRLDATARRLTFLEAATAGEPKA